MSMGIINPCSISGFITIQSSPAAARPSKAQTDTLQHLYQMQWNGSTWQVS